MTAHGEAAAGISIGGGARLSRESVGSLARTAATRLETGIATTWLGEGLMDRWRVAGIGGRLGFARDREVGAEAGRESKQNPRKKYIDKRFPD